MRNLKKLLALVLAMVMAFSLMLTVSAADVKYDDYSDKDSITAEFDEAVRVLTGLKVMQGDEKGFRPSDKITRAEAAAIIYRAVTGDVTDRQVALYADYGTFTDVNSGDWFAGYVGYCQNAGLIKGTTPTTFNPYGQVTGYEALAMILRAVGYGKNNEFTGASWQVNVAALARQLGVTRNVVAAHMDSTLNMAAPREVVADLIFMTIATVPTVTYTPALAYNDKQEVVSLGTNPYNVTLGQQVFGLYHATEWQVVDAWGNPGYKWYDNGAWDGRTVTGIDNGKGYMVPTGHPVFKSTSSTTTVATIAQAPDYQTTEQVHECDVAAAVDFDDEEVFNLYVNQKTALTDTYRVVATDTVTKVGGQGRLTKVYFEMENPWFTDDEDNHDNVVTMVDTMLALVTGKTDAKLDPAGHVITPAKLEVTIYDGMDKTNETSISSHALSTRIISKPSSSDVNWDEYAKGDYILLNAYTDKTRNATTPAASPVSILGNNTARGTQELLEKAAFETNKVVTTTSGYPANTLVAGGSSQNVWVLQKAESFQGKQTVTYWNQGKHQVDGKDYPDQICLFLDRAGKVTNTTFTWFLDQYGNLIGIGDAKATNYGVITSVYAAFVQGDSQTDGKVKAMATVKYTDGSTGTVEIDRFLLSQGATPVPDDGTVVNTYYGAVPNTALQMAGSVDVAGVATTIPADNTICLWPVYDNASHAAMSAGPAAVVPAPTTTEAEAVGWLYMAPSAVTNTNAHFGTATYASDAYGILYDHMFEFTTASDDSVVAIEVAGHTLGTTGVSLTAAAAGTDDATAMNNGLYVNNFNGQADDVNGKLFKALGFVTLDNSAAASATADVWLDNDTEIIIRDGSRSLSTYTLSTLPGNVDLDEDSEVDWADVDGDGRADYLYIQGTVPGAVTYGLFFYNGGAARWDAATNSGTIEGYLNGDVYTASFEGASGRTMFNTIQGSNAYRGHLFALQLKDDVVSNVMVAENKTQTAAAGTNVSPYILSNEVAPLGDNVSGTVLDFAATPASDTTATNIRTSGTGTWTWATATAFGLGVLNGNSYTVTTEAVYYNSAATNLSYERVSQGNRIVAGGDVYYIAPTAKIVGELDLLNTRTCDLTIVYENGAAKSAVQVYITTDPDITPDDDSVKAGTPGAGVDVLPKITGNDALTAAIKGFGPNHVVYSPEASTTAAGPQTQAPQFLYFPFTIGATAENATLTILNAKGEIVYLETNAAANVMGTAATTANNTYYFVINFTTGTGGANASVTEKLVAGTYTYQIVGYGTGSVLSSGTFTMN